MYRLSDRTEIHILSKTTAVVMVPLNSFHITVTCIKLSSLIIQISEATTLLRSDIQSYPISIIMVQNTGYNQEKKLP